MKSTVWRLRWMGPTALAAAVGLALAGVAAVRAADQPSVADTAAGIELAAQNTCPSAEQVRPVAATTASYARIDGITGDATRSGVAGQVVLTAVRTGLCGGGGTGAPSLDQLVVEKRIDRASVPLLQKAVSGAHIASVKVSVWTETQTPRELLSYTLNDVTVAYARQVQRGDSLTEEVGFAYVRITWAFTPVNPDGSSGATIRACWDRVRNVSC
jgi:type VI protein secretion system component Hcp